MNEFLNTVDPQTGMTLLQTLQGAAVALISVVVSAVVIYATAALRNVLPQFLASRIDEKLKRDIHEAAMTVVKNILQEGRSPQYELTRILEYMKASAKDAFANTLKNRSKAEAEQIFIDVALGKVPDAQKALAEAATTVIQGQLAEAVLEDKK